MAAIGESRLAALMENCASVRADFDKWAQNEAVFIESYPKEHRGVVKKAESEISFLKDKEVTLAAKGAELRQILQNEQDEIDTLTNDLNSLKEANESWPSKYEKARQDFDKNVSETAKWEEQIVKAEVEGDAKVREFTLGVEFYKQRLGMTFEKSGDSKIRVVFTHIDPENWTREFFFSVQIDENNCYKVDECCPVMEGLQELVDEVNRTNNFGNFVKAMRAKFCSLFKVNQIN